LQKQPKNKHNAQPAPQRPEGTAHPVNATKMASTGAGDFNGAAEKDALMQFDVKPIVLIVDDAPDNLMLMNELLQDRYEVKLANNGRNAMRIAGQAARPDLILLDVMMPKMDGYSVCRQLKADAATADIPIIFLTAKSQSVDEQRGFQEGAVDYISKPINPVTLQSRVSTHLQLKASREMLRDQNKHLAYLVEERTGELQHPDRSGWRGPRALSRSRRRGSSRPCKPFLRSGRHIHRPRPSGARTTEWRRPTIQKER
jgi:PleD family two-component response regulator